MAKFFVTLNVKPEFTLGGVRAASNAPKEFNYFGKKIETTLTGTARAADVKKGNELEPGGYGLLSVVAGKAQTKAGEDYLVGQMAGLSFWLVKTKKESATGVIYSGTLENGDGREFPIFARERKSKDGRRFLSVSAGEAQDKKQARARAASGTEKGKVPAAAASTFNDDDIPF